MWNNNEFTLQDIGIEGTFRLNTIALIPPEIIPKYNNKTKYIVSKNNTNLAKIEQLQLTNHGSYGNLFIAKRTTEDTLGFILLKEPRMSEMNLTQEAVLQHLAYKTMKINGMQWCIPRVYDIFLKDNHTWFSMEYIKGITVIDWISNSKNIEYDFFCFIAQISLLLLCLKKYLMLDHRDLKADNILIKQKSCNITCSTELNGEIKTFTFQCPFSIVILDFGFACLGSGDSKRTSILNLGDGVLPPMDPCPKEGRDLFQLLISLISIKLFRDKCTNHMNEKLDIWLFNGKKSYSNIARRWSTENWSYLVVSEPNFSFHACCPENIVLSLLKDIPDILQII